MEGYQSPSTWKKLHSSQVVKHAHVALWEGFESSRDGNHMLAYPPGKSPMCKPAGRPPTNYMCTSACWVSLTFLRSKRRGAERFPPSGKSLTHDMCRLAAGKESHSSECVGEAAWQDKVPCSLLSLPAFILSDNEVNLAWGWCELENC